jgi:hypothetical protein
MLRYITNVNISEENTPVDASESRSVQAAKLVAGGSTFAKAAQKLGITPQAVNIAWNKIFPGVSPPEKQIADIRKEAILSLISKTVVTGKGKKKSVCSLSVGQIVTQLDPGLEATEKHVRAVANSAGIRLTRSSSSRIDCTLAFEALRAGASITEAAPLADIAPGTLSRLASRAGIEINRSQTGQRDGRILRAVLRVLLHGQDITQACVEELCAQPGVRNALNHGTTGLRLCQLMSSLHGTRANLTELCACSGLIGSRTQIIVHSLIKVGLVEQVGPYVWKLTSTGLALCVALVGYRTKR